ncbi:hypothetical protein QBC40DRAFT_280254 [Triangularia verruculosa]|uniref:Uncharacterized protein n=1 Tax=Triangularia verruculosa TaxID=2587418 RepID=A0AAN7AT82_9PEZI|nr:hypothetical protein QBC40DRAFT_280254 [Triangularia verruculosa]
MNLRVLFFFLPLVYWFLCRVCVFVCLEVFFGCWSCPTQAKAGGRNCIVFFIFYQVVFGRFLSGKSAINVFLKIVREVHTPHQCL